MVAPVAKAMKSEGAVAAFLAEKVLGHSPTRDVSAQCLKLVESAQTDSAIASATLKGIYLPDSEWAGFAAGYKSNLQCVEGALARMKKLCTAREPSRFETPDRVLGKDLLQCLVIAMAQSEEYASIVKSVGQEQIGWMAREKTRASALNFKMLLAIAGVLYGAAFFYCIVMSWRRSFIRLREAEKLDAKI